MNRYSSKNRNNDTGRHVTIADVTLREHGQNLKRDDLAWFTPDFRAETARRLARAGFSRIEAFSCVSPKVAPAMAKDQLEKTVERMGRLPGVRVVTLVPNMKGLETFFELGLGPAGLGHAAGVFVSSVDEHNLENLNMTVEDSMAELEQVSVQAAREGVKLVAYISAAFGYVTKHGRLVRPDDESLLAMVDRIASFGVESITLSDLQGVAAPARTRAVMEKVRDKVGSWIELGYHGHCIDQQAGLARAKAALDAGVTVLDGSMAGTGGCVTGAPANLSVESLVEMVHDLGFDTGIDRNELNALARAYLP